VRAATAWGFRGLITQAPGALALGAVLLLLSACGFQLRGADLRSSVARVYLEASPRHSFAVPMRLALEQSGVDVLAKRAPDALTLDLVDERRQRRSISVSEAAVAAEYEVRVAVRYAVRAGDGSVLQEPLWVERERVYRVDSDNILGSSEERALLEDEMRDELIRQIIRALDVLDASARGTAGR
jgi:LPS-assembly lipoprotein